MKVLSSTDLADVSSGQTDQRGKPVCDVEESFGDASPVFQQRTVNEGHAADAALPVRSLKKHSEVVFFSPPQNQPPGYDGLLLFVVRLSPYKAAGFFLFYYCFIRPWIKSGSVLYV